MTHISNFGKFSDSLKPLADLRGYIPQAGDEPDSMEWDGAIEWDDDSWAEHVAECAAAIAKAEAAVSEWRAQ